MKEPSKRFGVLDTWNNCTWYDILQYTWYQLPGICMWVEMRRNVNMIGFRSDSVMYNDIINTTTQMPRNRDGFGKGSILSPSMHSIIYTNTQQRNK